MSPEVGHKRVLHGGANTTNAMRQVNESKLSSCDIDYSEMHSQMQGATWGRNLEEE
jgi:hypothetical protein